MPNQSPDLTIFAPGGVFNLRVGAVILRRDQVLLVNNGLHYYSIGGRVKLHETLEQAVKREIMEETGEIFEVDRLLWINEGFFTLKGGAYDGQRFHEISFIFLMKPKPDTKIGNGCVLKDDAKEWLEWVPIDELGNHIVYPEIIKTDLRRLPDQPVHIVKIE